MPLRQAMGAVKGFPPMAEIHDVRSGEVDFDPHVVVPAAPHVQPQGLRRVKLHYPRKRSREAEMIAHGLVQPDEELTGLVSDMALHWGKDRWRRRGRCAAVGVKTGGSRSRGPKLGVLERW